MKSNSIFFNALMLVAPVALCLQFSPLAQGRQQTTTQALPVQSATGAAPTAQENVDFFFAGGTPSDFISAVEKQYKVDWAEVVDIPDNMANGQVHIPALRMNRQSAEHILAVRGFGDGGEGVGTRGRQGGRASDRGPLDALVALYNSLGEANPELGRLTVEGDLSKPSIVIFHPIRSRLQSRSPMDSSSPIDNSDFKMKAFSLNGIPEGEWEKLEKVIDSELHTLAGLQIGQSRHRGEHLTTHEQDLIYEDSLLSHSRVTLYKDTGLLIVRGPESILEAAESLVTAWRSKQPPVVKF